MGRRSAGATTEVGEARASSPRSSKVLRWSSWNRILVLGLAALVILGVSSVHGGEVKGLGFYPPFQTFNARGDRTVLSWTFGGAAVAKQSFVRLTPDRLDNFGTIYSRLTGRFSNKPTGGQFSLAMTFRISGATEKNHGKYLTLALGNPEMLRRRGDTYGFPEDFIGVGIVISPRPPADMTEPSGDPTKPAGPRQFVSFFANNGTRTTTDVRMMANSCASTLRYWQGRDDFSFLKSSRVRLGYSDGSVTLEVDARNIGVWRKCISTQVLDMPEGWLDRAAVAITSETGHEVSNYHDVMSLEVYTDREEAFNDKLVDGTVEGEEADNSEEAEKAARTAKIYAMRAHLEHEFDSVERILKDSVSKLAYNNDDIMRRITKIEKDVSTEAFAFLNGRVKGMEQRIKDNAAPALDSRLQNAQTEFQDEMGQSMENLLVKGTGWKLPFGFVLCVILAVFVLSVKQYRRLTRSPFMGVMR